MTRAISFAARVSSTDATKKNSGTQGRDLVGVRVIEVSARRELTVFAISVFF